METLDQADHEGDCKVDDEPEDGQNWAYLTRDTLDRTPKGVTAPLMVTFLDSISMLYDVTPAPISKRNTTPLEPTQKMKY